MNKHYCNDAGGLDNAEKQNKYNNNFKIRFCKFFNRIIGRKIGKIQVS